MTYFFVSLVLFLGFRGYWFLKSSKHGDVTQDDSMGHLNYVKEYYLTNGKPLDFSNLYILDGPDYPNGFHKVFYHLRIPLSFLERYGGIVPLLADLCLLVTIFVAITLFGGQEYIWLLAFPFLRLLYGNVGRALHFSERAYGVLWGNLYLFSAVAFYITREPLWLVLGGVSFTIFSISSKFAWQGTAFVSILLSVFTLQIYFAAVYVFNACVSFVVSRGYSWQVLKGTVRHSHFYRTHLAPRNPQSIRSHYAELFQFSGFKRYIFKLFTNSPLRIISDNPLLLVIFGACLVLSPPLSVWALWSLCGPFLVLLISTKFLSFLGEPERYLEFTLLPTFVFLSYVPFSALPVATILACLGLLAVLLFHLYVSMHAGLDSRQQQDMISLRDYWSEIENATVVSVPFRLSFFLGYKNRANRYVTLFSNIGKSQAGEDYKWLMRDRYPFVRGDLPSVCRKHSLDYIVVDRKAVASLAIALGGNYYDFTPYDLVYQNEHYSVYKVLR